MKLMAILRGRCGYQSVLTMRWIFLSLAFLLVVGVAQSGNPVPSESKEATAPRQHSKNTNTPGVKDPRGTEKQPFVIKIVDDPKAENISAKDEKRSSDKASLIWGMTAEEATAIFTLALVIVGALTAAVLICQSYLLRQQVIAARNEFNAVHRPKIRVRYVWPKGELWGDGKIAIRAQIANVGITRAKIIEYSARPLVLAKDKPLPPIPEYRYKVAVNTDPYLESGSSTNLPPNADLDIPGLQVTYIQAFSHDDHSAIRSGERRLYFLGYVKYEDAGGRPITTAFCRVLERPTGTGSAEEIGRFVRLSPENPDYEYED